MPWCTKHTPYVKYEGQCPVCHPGVGSGSPGAQRPPSPLRAAPSNLSAAPAQNPVAMPVALPPAAAAVALQPIALPQPPVAQAGIFLYRADTRSPEELKRDGGFKPWKTLTLPALKELIEFIAGAKLWTNCSLVKAEAERLPDFPPRPLSFADPGKTKPMPLPENPTVDPLTFHEWIIRSRDRGPSISFAQSENGTYPYGASNEVYLYRVSFNLPVVAWATAVPNAKVKIGPRVPQLCLDGATLATSSKIAIKGMFGNTEISCLYDVPEADIVAYKRPPQTLINNPVSLADPSIIAAEKKKLWKDK